MFRHLTLFLLPAFAACSGPQQPQTQVAQLADFVVLEQGETALFPERDITVRFDSISADNRCLEDAQCLDAGEASVHFTLSEDGATTPFMLTIEGNISSESPRDITEAMSLAKEQEYQTVGAYEAALFLLQPYPGFAAERKMAPTVVFEIKLPEE